VVGYRSEFLHLWVVGPAELDPQSVIEGLGDLERGALGLPAGVVPPPGLGLPLEVQHAFAGIQFLKDQLWESRPHCAGFVFLDGRVWAVRAGLDVRLEQMTGATVRWRWHDWEGGVHLAWTELAAAEVWRLTIAHGATELFAHYRPALAAVPQVSTAADAFAAAAASEGRRGTSRNARRRRHRRENALVEAAAPALEIVPPSLEVVAPPFLEVAPPALEVLSPSLEVVPPAPEAAPRVAQPRVTRPTPARVPPSPRQLATPRRVRPQFALPRIPTSPRTIGIGAAAAALLAALIAGGFAARRPIEALVVGRYALALTTSPAGAKIKVDGKWVVGRTPMTLELAPGEHQVDLKYGDYANAGFTVDGARGDALQRQFAWSGALGVANSDSTVRLAVTLDGKPLGHAPLWQDSVPVGRHRLGFSAPGVRAWEEEVQVRSGQSARVTAVPVKVPNYGLVTARAELTSSDGVEDLDGMPVFVDGISVGVTPVDLRLTPGPHSIKIARDGRAPSIHLIDVQAGGRFFATAGFGRPADPVVAFEPPARISRAAPPTIALRLEADLPLPVRQAALHVRAPGGTYARFPIAWNAAGGRGQGSFTFPLDRLGNAKALSYYVEIETREGEEYFSEVHTIPIVP
jgi:hypothetical protein